MYRLGSLNEVLDLVSFGSISNMLKRIVSGVNTSDYSFAPQHSNAYNRDHLAFRFDSSFQGENVDGMIAAYKAELARLYENGTPLEIAYGLATPVEYTLTAEQVGGILTTLKGENNVWADTGDIEVTVYGVPIVEPQADTLTSLNILLGGAYRNAGTADDVSDEEALNILLGGADR